jgi:hypothetical protein
MCLPCFAVIRTLPRGIGTVISGPQPEVQQGGKPRVAVRQSRRQESATSDEDYQKEVADEPAGGFGRSRVTPGLPVPGVLHYAITAPKAMPSR